MKDGRIIYSMLICFLIGVLILLGLFSCEREYNGIDISKAQAVQSIDYDGISFHTAWSQFHWQGQAYITAYVYDYSTDEFTLIDENFEGWIKWKVESNGGDTTFTTNYGDLNHGNFRFYNPDLPLNPSGIWINPLAQWMFKQTCQPSERMRMTIEVEGYEKQGYCGNSRVFYVSGECDDYCDAGNFDIGIWDLLPPTQGARERLSKFK
jgi:hypothetical protein